MVKQRRTGQRPGSEKSHTEGTDRFNGRGKGCWRERQPKGWSEGGSDVGAVRAPREKMGNRGKLKPEGGGVGT